MFNLQQYQFSNVSKISNTRSKTIKASQNEQKKEKLQSNSQILLKQCKKNKNKNKLSIQDPIKTYQKIKQWRKKNIAPVDTIGCEKLAQQNQPDDIKKYQILISLMLSVQTTDQITSMVVKRLQQYGLNPQNISKISQNKLVQLIHESNFNKRKAKNIIEVSKIIKNKGLPNNKQQLLEFPGIGVKIAMIYLRTAYGIQDGIGVDTHVHRISNKLGWVNTNNPNETEKQLQTLFPKKYWTDINIFMVGFGQILCNAKKPLCSKCPVKFECPSSLIKQNIIQQW